MKSILVIALLNLACFSAFADEASNDSKLALFIANPARMNALYVSSNESTFVDEQTIKGDESSSVIVTIKVDGQNIKYLITKDGGGQILSIKLLAKK